MRTLFLLSFLIFNLKISAQQNNSYPKIVGYASVVQPLVTQDADGTHYNFDGSYTVGFPCGINILKSDRFGFSFEITPFINATNGVSKTNNFLFHPGLMFRRPHGFTFITRAAFETAGRYGFTFVFNKVLIKTKTNNYFVAVPIPVRFGNDKPASVGVSLQLGITF